MTQTAITAKFRDYRFNTARLNSLKLERQRLKSEISRLDREQLEAITLLKASGGSPGHSGAISDPTGRTAAKLADGLPPTRLQNSLKIALAGVERRIDSTVYDLKLCDCWLDALSDEERFVISRRLIEGDRWETLRERYADRYYYVSTDTLMRRCSTALEKLEKLMDPA